MTLWGSVAIAVGVVLVAALVLGLWLVATRRRTERLRRRFGPEYERTVQQHDSRSEAEAELSDRVRRREELQIRPLAPEEREHYLEAWREVQAQFVDAPEAAVASAHSLIRSAMSERGYPVEDFEQRSADLSVDHPVLVENYRIAQATATKSARGEASTEELRQAMQHYRGLFDELLETSADAPLSREAAEEETTTKERVTR